MAGIGEIVALAKGLGGSGGGGSSGGVLVVTNTDGTLNKTCKEIYDASRSGIVVIVTDNEANILVQSGKYNGSYFFNIIFKLAIVQFSGNGDNEYPVRAS